MSDSVLKCFMCAHYGENRGDGADTCLINPKFELDEDSDIPQKCIDNGDYTPNSEHLYDEKEDADKLKELAEEKLRDNPLKFIIETLGKMHMGDEQAARILILSLVVQNVKNSKGFHPGLHGASGKGKSDLAKAIKHLTPAGMVLETSLSSKVLFYEDLANGVVILSDEIELEDDMRTTLKRCTTNFTEPTMHKTLNKNRVPETHYIPPRMVWWLTSVDADSSDQILNREIPCNVDETEETDEAVFRHQLELFRTGRMSLPETNEVRICRAMFKITKDALYIVNAPFATEDRVEWNNKNNRRNFDVFVDLAKAVALLWRYQRNKSQGLDGQITIEATEDDYIRAARIYGAFGESQATKLTKSEMDVLRYLGSRAQANKERYGVATIYEIQAAVDLTRGRCHHILHGKDGVSGLLIKVPALSYEPETEHIDELGDVMTDRDGREYQEVVKRKSRPKNIYKLDTMRFDPFKSYESVTVLK